MFNFVRSAKEKFLEAILKDGMIGWAKTPNIRIWAYARSQLSAMTI
jgi:hypothetical protein